MKFSNFLKYLIIILIPLNIFQPVKAVLFEIIELAQDAQAKNKIEFIKWGLKSSKDIKKLKSKEIKSLLEGKILSGTYNDNTVSEPWEECSYYKNGTVKCQPEEKSEKWKVANDQLCFIPGGCVTVYKSIGDGSPNYFFKKYGVLFARFDEIDSIEERRLEKEKRVNKLNKINDAILSLENNIKIIKGFLVMDQNSIYLEEWLSSVKNALLVIDNPSSYDQLLATNDDLIKLIKQK